MLVEGSMPVAARVGQLIKFDGISFSHGGHTSVAASLPRSCLDCMRRSGAPCSSAEHLWCDALEVPVALAEVEGANQAGPLRYPLRSLKPREQNLASPLGYPLLSPKSRERNLAGPPWRWLSSAACVVASPLVSGNVVERP